MSRRAKYKLVVIRRAQNRCSPPKKQQYHWSKDVGAVPRTARQARSGIGPYKLKAVSYIDNPVPKRGPWLAMTLFLLALEEKIPARESVGNFVK
jgi:hypothetical protein